MKTARRGVDCIIKMLSLCLVALSASPLAAQQLELQGPDKVSKEGYFSVTVTGTGTKEQPPNDLQNLRLQLSKSSEFSQVLQEFPALGDFRQLSLSGFSNGEYFIRAIADNVGQPSDPIKVTVSHYPLWQALSLFVAGLLLFTVLLITLWQGQRLTNQRATK